MKTATLIHATKTGSSIDVEPVPTSVAAPKRAGAIEEPADIDRIWELYRTTKDAVVRNRLIEIYYPQVRQISERMVQTLPKSVDLDDLSSWGLFGLMDAIDGFDPNRGVKFRTYCSTRIRGAILDELRNQDWVPRLVRMYANKIARAWKAVEGRIGREPTDEEMATELATDVEEYRHMKVESMTTAVYSLSDRVDSQDDDGNENAEMLSDARAVNPIDVVQGRDLLETLTRHLAPKEKRIIISYYYEGLTMRDIGRMLDLTESRVCQIHGNIMLRLRETLTTRAPKAEFNIEKSCPRDLN